MKTIKIYFALMITLFTAQACSKEGLAPAQCTNCPQNNSPVVTTPQNPAVATYFVNKVQLAQDISTLPVNAQDTYGQIYSDLQPMDGFADGTYNLVYYYWSILFQDVVQGFNAQGQLVSQTVSTPYYVAVPIDNTILERLKQYPSNAWNVVKYNKVVASSSVYVGSDGFYHLGSSGIQVQAELK